MLRSMSGNFSSGRAAMLASCVNVLLHRVAFVAGIDLPTPNVASNASRKCVSLDWKTGVVTAIYKEGTKSDMGNYRPVSLTSVVCKILESIIRDHIIKHLTVNKLISNKQYGFVKGRSTSRQLLHMLDNWTEFLESWGADRCYIYRF